MKKIIILVLTIKLIITIILLIVFSSCKKELSLNTDSNPLNYEGVWKSSETDTISFSIHNGVPVLNYYMAGLLGTNKVYVKALIRSNGYNSDNNTYNYNLTIPYLSVFYDTNSTIMKLDSVIIRGKFILISENEILANYYYTQGRKSPVSQQLYFTK